MAEFRMPSLGADMTEGTLVEWLVRPGDHVRKGDPVAVVDTAKAAIEVECFTTGVVERLLVQPGDLVPVGAPLAIITATASVAAVGAPAGPVPAGPVPAAVAPLGSEPAPAPTAVPVRASPVVRRFAAAHHVDLTAVHGTGLDGRVTHADVEHAARRPVSPLARRLAAELGVDLASVRPASPGRPIGVDDVRRAAAKTAPATALPPAPVPAPALAPVPAPEPAGGQRDQSAVRAAIAALMARSKREIPHYYLSTTIDMFAATEWLRRRNRQTPVTERLVPAVLLLKATALAARAVPEMNGYWIDGRLHQAPAVHLGVAVSMRGGGLLTPAIRDAADLPLPELMNQLRDLVARARKGRLRASELSDPTITVSNLGDLGAESILGVIYPPQVTLVGFGTVLERPWAVGGLIGVRPLCVASVSGDHRATDGHTGARFLSTLDQLLQRPEEL